MRRYDYEAASNNLVKTVIQRLQREGKGVCSLCCRPYANEHLTARPNGLTLCPECSEKMTPG